MIGGRCSADRIGDLGNGIRVAIKQEYLNIAVGIAPGQVCVEMKGNAGAIGVDRCIVFLDDSTERIPIRDLSDAARLGEKPSVTIA